MVSTPCTQIDKRVCSHHVSRIVITPPRKRKIGTDRNVIQNTGEFRIDANARSKISITATSIPITKSDSRIKYNIAYFILCKSICSG